MKRIFGFVLSIWVSVGVSAQHTLTLDSCRAMALKSNKELRISAEKINVRIMKRKLLLRTTCPRLPLWERICAPKKKSPY